MIKEFKGDYRWLSNFYPVQIVDRDYTFQSVEHAYQSYKSDNTTWIRLCAYGNLSPGKIKILSQNTTLVDNWKSIRVGIMESLLELKFSQEPFRTLLLNTGSEEIQEGNSWGDTFWGVSLKTGKGQNIMGQIIMGIRGALNLQRFC